MGEMQFPSKRDLEMLTGTPRSVLLLLVLILLVGLPRLVRAAVGGSISGTVKDPSGAVIPNATVIATNTDTGTMQVVKTNDAGAYSFPSLPVGHYDVDITVGGFKSYRRANITVDVNSALFVDAMLELGENLEIVTVRESAMQVETASTQLGNIIAATSVAALPLNGRSYTDLLALQPGVMPLTTITSAAVVGLGQTVFSPSGDLNAGAISINGQRESANGYLVNGADAEETGSMAAAIIPNLDSIAEFRILSDNFDAEFGKYSGGQINVVTKSGTNQLHGDAFEFLRNTDLDARNPFSPTRATYIQNQFGATAGGSIVRNKIFFFSDYQGTRQIEGTDTGNIAVPSLQERMGDFLNPDGTSPLTGMVSLDSSPYVGTDSDSSIAAQLTQKLGYPVSGGEPYYFYQGELDPLPGNPTHTYPSSCTSSANCVFPGAVIPQRAWSAPALALLKYIPLPNPGEGNNFSTSAYDQILRDDKIGERVDANTRWGAIFGYYSFDDYSLNNPYPTGQAGASVPGFNGLNTGRAQLYDLGDTNTFGSIALNEFHITYTRDSNDLGKPVGGLGVSLASQGFTGIVPLAPNQGVESMIFNSFSIGSVPQEFHQINNDFGLNDGFSKIVGTHSIKAGAQLEYDQINTYPFADLNGSFDITGQETGLDFADFLIGVSSIYTQNQLRAFYGRAKYVGIFGQDSWRVTHSLTLNYGLRWDRIEPWYEKYNNAMTFIPGEQSVVFPSAPAGIVYPGDPAVSRTLARPGNKDFAPRLGLAYSPHARGDSLLGKVLGDPGKTSVRAGFGMFYVAIPGETLGLVSDNAPYGFTYTGYNPLLATPFVDITGHPEGQRFPVQLAPTNVSPSNPDSSLNFSQFEPISTIPGYKTTNVIPYTEEFMLSLQRQIGTSNLLNVTYVGNEGHHLLVLEPANPGNPALCLSIPGCGPGGENTYRTRGPLGSNFGDVSYQASMGNSTYNALEVSLHHTSKRVELFASYTYSKSIDDGSNFGDQADPFDPTLLRGLSSFDMRQNFVASYTYKVPFERLFRGSNRWTEGWSVSGITRFSSGFPVTLINPIDDSLIGSEGNGINATGLDELTYTGEPLNLNSNPRNGKAYFNPSAFTSPADDRAAGNTIANTIGNSGRRPFSGPGINNFDLTLQKNLKLTESKSFEFRVEAFNAFNHAQFYGPSAVQGNIDSGNFGKIVSAAAPRLLQIVSKIIF